METNLRCHQCAVPVDFSKEASGFCSTCKKELCWDCCHAHECLPGKRGQLQIIINPQWIVNLKQTLHE